MLSKGDLVRVDTLGAKVHVVAGVQPQLGGFNLYGILCGKSVHPDRIMPGVLSADDLAGPDGCDICAARLAAFNARPSDDLEKSVLAFLVDIVGLDVAWELLPGVVPMLTGSGPESWLFRCEDRLGNVRQGRRLLPDRGLRAVMFFYFLRESGLRGVEPGESVRVDLRLEG